MFRRNQAEGTSGSVLVVAAGPGVLIQGDPGAIEAFAARMEQATEGVGCLLRRAAGAVSLLGNVAAVAATHREYFEFSPEAKRLLQEFKAIPTEDGFFRSFVRSGNQFAGNLDWKPVTLVPERALALQSIGMQLALQTAIKNVQAAIERVEGKVDHLLSLVRAERLGAATGDHRTLSALAERARAGEPIGGTDWSTVDSLGAQIARDIEALRSYVLREASAMKESPLVRTRNKELAKLTDELLRESLALLLLAEHNHALWQEIRIARVRAVEPQVLEATLRDSRGQLDSLRSADQKLIEALGVAGRELLEPTGYEGFALLKRRHLLEQGAELNEAIGWFAEQRNLDFQGARAELPTCATRCPKRNGRRSRVVVSPRGRR